MDRRVTGAAQTSQDNMEGEDAPDASNGYDHKAAEVRLLACPFDRHSCPGFTSVSRVGEHLKRSHTLKHGCSTCGHRFGARSDKRLELDKEEHKAKCGTSSQRGKRAKLMTPKEDEDYNALKKCDWISMYRVFNREGLIPSQYLGARSVTEEGLGRQDDEEVSEPVSGLTPSRTDDDSAIDVGTKVGEAHPVMGDFYPQSADWPFQAYPDEVPSTNSFISIGIEFENYRLQEDELLGTVDPGQSRLKIQPRTERLPGLGIPLLSDAHLVSALVQDQAVTQNVAQNVAQNGELSQNEASYEPDGYWPGLDGSTDTNNNSWPFNVIAKLP